MSPCYKIARHDNMPNFTRRIENFTCINCKQNVIGNGYTDHCPSCLTSRHVDINPGDRASECMGTMNPKSAIYKSGAFTILLECTACRQKKKVCASKDDNIELLIHFSTIPYVW